MQLPSAQEMEAYIRAKAMELGIDPDIAVRVAKSEGLKDGTWQANSQLSYGRERSYGPYQLHVDPRPGHGGMGNDFIKATGLDPSNPAYWRQGVDFALNQAKHGGWSPWYGAKHIGVTGFMGIGGQPHSAPPVASGAPSSGAGTSMGGFAEGPQAVAARMPNGGLLSPDADPLQAGNAFTGYHDRWAALGKMAEELAASQEDTGQDALPPTPQILQPLRRIQIGGLLG